MGLLGNFVGQALGMQSAEEYAQSVEAADRLQRLQRANRTRKNQLEYGVDKTQRGGTAGVTPFNPDDAFSFDNLQQPGLRNVPPATDNSNLDLRGPAAPADETVQNPPVVADPAEEGSTGVAPTVPEFDSSKTVINPNDNQNIPNNQIPVPEFTNPDLSSLFPKGVVPEDSVSDENKQSLHVQGMPWKVIDKNGGKVVVHNGVEYNIQDLGDGSFILSDRYGRPNYPLTTAFTEGRQRGITNTEITPRTSSAADDLAAATVDNKYISNALKTIKNNKFQNGITNATTAYARQFGIDQGEALAILAIESNFGTVKYDNRSSTRGPFQVQKLAYKDVKDYFKGPKPKGIDVSDEQWAAMTAAAAKMPKNHANLTNTNDQIAAGLLYFKMIGLKGVDKKFQAAAYYDGYGKYIGINDISDVKNFSGPNTLETVTRYNSAFLGMRDYMGQVADYYYPQGGALVGTSTTTQGNTVGQPSGNPAGDAAAEQFDGAVFDMQSRKFVDAGNPPAGMVWDNTKRTFVPLRELPDQDTGGVSAVDMPELPDQDTGGVSAVDMPNLADKDAAPTVEVDGQEEPSVATPDVDPDITKFLRNPPNIGIETQNLLDQRKLAVDALNRQLSLVNEEIMRNNQKVAEYERMAQVARISGDLDGYERYRGLADGLNSKSNAIREQAIIAQDTARATMLDFDNKLLLVQGAQALQDLGYGSTARAGAVLSAYAGMEIQVVPRSDGKFDIVVKGERQATYTYDELVDKLQSTYSAAYRESKAKAAEKRQTYLFEKGVDLQKALIEEEAKLLNSIQLEEIKLIAQQQLEYVKQSGGEFKALGDGTALVLQNGQFFLLDPDFEEETLVDGKKEVVVKPKLIPLPRGEGLAKLAELETSGEAYDSNAAAKIGK